MTVQKYIQVLSILVIMSDIGQTQDTSMRIQPFGQWVLEQARTHDVTLNYSTDLLDQSKVRLPINTKDIRQVQKLINQYTKYTLTETEERKWLLSLHRQGSLINEVSMVVDVVDDATNFTLPSAGLFSEEDQLVNVADEHGHIKHAIPSYPPRYFIIKYLGYKDDTLIVNAQKDKYYFKCNMKQDETTLEGVIIEDFRHNMWAHEHTSTQIFIKDLPHALGMGEKDVMRTLQFIPGIIPLGESNADISIRGSTADQNLILWNDIPLYRTGHFNGLIGAINPFMVDTIHVMYNGFGVEYGSRTAGVVKMDTDDKHARRLHVNTNTNLLSSNIGLDMPIVPHKLSFQGAIRHSYGRQYQSWAYDKLFSQTFQSGRITEVEEWIVANGVMQDVVQEPALNFSDFFSGILYTPTKKDILKGSILGITNDFTHHVYFSWDEKKETDLLKTSMKGISGQWYRHWSKNFQQKFNFSSVQYGNKYAFIKEQSNNYIINERINKNQINEKRAKLSWALDWSSHMFTWGGEWVSTQIDNQRKYSVLQYYETGLESTKKAHLYAGFVEYGSLDTEDFEVNFGIRYSYYNLTNLFYAEPRLSFRRNFTPRSYLFFSAGMYNQTVAQIEEYNSLESEKMYWQLADGTPGSELVPITKNTQFLAGYTFKGSSYNISVSTYSKRLEHVTALALEFDDGVNPWWIAEGKCTGIDFSFSKKFSLHSLSIGYNYSDVILDFYEDAVYPAPYTSKHNGTIVYMFHPHHWVFSLTGVFRSGRPYTVYSDYSLTLNEFNDPILNFVYDKDQFIRFLPSYLRFDISIVYALRSLINQKVNLNIGFSCNNVLNTDNIIHISNDVDYRQWPDISPRTLTKYGLGITPNLFIEMSF